MPAVPGFARRIDSVATDERRQCAGKSRVRGRPGALATTGGDHIRSDLWLRAVVAGGQGRYASALTDLSGVCRAAAPRPAGVAGAQHPRVVPASARMACPCPHVGRPGVGARRISDPEAGADALIGLAADALGVGRFAASATALARAADLLTVSVPPRLPVRLAWVSAELAMARADGATAVGHAERSVDAGGRRWARHGMRSNRTWCSPRRCAAQAKSIGRARLQMPRSMRPMAWESSRCAGRWRACWPTSAVPVTPWLRCAGFVTSAQIRCVAEAAPWRFADNGRASRIVIV